ncbi:histidinol dehydrogenase [Solimonas fluminis]|uniref:Histidinol dehydrogenase n=1 Tax=Solimonas fluminis TaxID=2086571 RepID=A0A2S5TGW7_9GAMM|nr:histidinol dehydrogenase [Solimonas fluminis]PPE74223.1 histidinol dehydrogenase [Solimonas fluminis]
MIEINRLDTRDAGFDAALGRLLDRAPEQDGAVLAAVEKIVADVRARGDDAVLELTNRFDRRSAASIAELEIGKDRLRQGWEALPADLRAALEEAAARIRAYAEHQRIAPFEYTDAHGNRMGQMVTPLDRAGLYVPGGKAAYPSSVLMNAIPAKVAGVGEVIMVVPAPGGELNDAVLGAAHLAGVDRVFTVGGAQAVAALAYGTATIPAMDKIVGPGNAYVAAAKRIVFGQVGIDSIAGPSEIVVIGDGLTDPRWIAMDLFSQAEHGEDSEAILISPDRDYLDRVAQAMEERVKELPREKIVRSSIRDRGALIAVRDLAEAAAVSNRIAPEHLELSVAEPRELLKKIRHAGAVFLGRHAPESFGDYCAGPNHVLPTSRAARFSNPLGVYEFQKRSSLIDCTPEGAKPLARIAGRIADAEGLQAHAQSARDRG